MTAMEEANEIQRQERTYVSLDLSMDDIDYSPLCILGRRLCPFEVRLQLLLTSDE
jgi:hypothetical protein